MLRLKLANWRSQGIEALTSEGDHVLDRADLKNLSSDVTPAI